MHGEEVAAMERSLPPGGLLAARPPDGAVRGGLHPDAGLPTVRPLGTTLVLPLPPSLNHYWKHWRNRVVKTTEAKDYVRTVRVQALARRMKPMMGAVGVTMHVYRRQRRGDLDGFQKLLLDALQGVAYENDSQVTELHAYRHEDPSDPRVVVTFALAR